MIRYALLFAACTLAIPLHAQEKPKLEAPHFSRHIFVAGVSLPAGSKTAYAITTRQLLDRGSWEGNPRFGRHPSPGKQAGIDAGIFPAQAGLFYLTKRSRHSWIRWTGRAFLAHTIEEHSRLPACNARIDTPSAHLIRNCRAGGGAMIRRFLVVLLLAVSRCKLRASTLAPVYPRSASEQVMPFYPFSVSDPAWTVIIVPEKEWFPALTKEQRGRSAGTCATLRNKKLTYCNAEWVKHATPTAIGHTLPHEYRHILCACGDDDLAETRAKNVFHD